MKISDIVNGTYEAILFIDFETRSKADIKNLGAHRYASDPSTEILLTAYALDKGDINVDERDHFSHELVVALQNPNVLKVAHNAEFDMAILKHVSGMDIEISEWFDTAFQGAYYAHPRHLKGLAKRLNITEKGAGDGILTFSLPRKKSKSEDTPSLFAVERSDFNEPKDFPKEWEEFKTYAWQDISTMREAFYAMPMLPEIEIFTSHITMEMNFNGVPFDHRLGIQIYNKAKDYERNVSKIAKEKYGIENLKSTAQVQKALRANGVILPSLNKKERAGVEHEILDLRDTATGSAFSKIPTALERMCSDGFLHGEFVGNGAHTGRWTSRGVQLQNWARIQDDVSENLEDVKSYDHLRQHMRLCLGHVHGLEFTFADLSQIEARIVAWLAWSKWRMEAFADDIDIYARSAEKMFNLKKKLNKDSKERYYGKCAELGFGYGGGHMAIKTIQPDFYREVGEPMVKELVQKWRNANPEIKWLWNKIEKAMHVSMKSGSEIITCGKAILKFKYDGKTGIIMLPSGRSLYYRGLHCVSGRYEGSYDLMYMDYTRGGSPVRVHLWGGILLENITQALARDVLVDIMQRVKERVPRADAACIGTVHDEIWYLNKPSVPMLDVLLEEMARPITWASGLITKGDGLTSDRYRK